MTKKKLNNLLNFIILSFPFLIIICSLIWTPLSINGLSDLLTFINNELSINFSISILDIFKYFNNGVVPSSSMIILLSNFISWSVLVTFTIIVKDLLLLLINICNKYLLKED